MLKFFRKYNKYILAVGGSLLMIGFMIQPVMSMFQADPMDRVVGTVDDQEITMRDLRSADAQLAVLARFRLGLDRDPDQPNSSNDALRWTLIMHDAQRLGLSASQYEVDQVRLAAGASDADLARMASNVRASPGFIRLALQNWLIVQRYKELAAGQGYLAGTERAQLLRGVVQNPQAYLYYEALAYGSARLSKPLIEHFLQDQGASVSGRVVLIPADEYLAQAPKPSEEKVAELFEQFKDDLPGAGEPYGFGYRVPDRVKIEYMTISMDQARQQVKVTEAKALAYYRRHADQYTDSGIDTQDAAPQPYEEVRDRVIEDLTEEQAYELVEKMAKVGYGMLYEDTRGMAKKSDYRVVADPSAMTSLREVAERLEQEFGLLPQVRRMAQAWVNAEDLRDLPGLGQSFLVSNLRVDLTSYVLSAKELEPADDNPLRPLRLQKHLAGSPMMGLDGSRHLFRLIDAQPTRVPEGIDEVSDQVTRDAGLLAVYQELVSQSQTWRNKAVAKGLDAVASQVNTVVVSLPPTPRRVPDRNGLLVPPRLPGVGQSDAFVQAFYNTADRTRGNGPIQDAGDDVLTGVVGVDHKLSLAVFRVDDYQPLTREQFKRAAGSATLPIQIDLTVMSPARQQNPLSLKALSRRLNYDDGRGGDEEGEEIEKAGN